jgi:geranylgeranylglycerol-phosphate geranylgeranyltransferase
VSRIIEFIRLIRVINCLLAMVGVGIGAYFTWLTPVYYGPLVASLAAFFVCAAGNTVNDLVDIETDRINHPGRVLVRGTVSRAAALRLAIALNLLALLMAATVSLAVTIIAVAAVLLLLAYNLWLKKIVLLGNSTVALLAGLTFLTGGLAVDVSLAFRLPGPTIPLVFAFLFHLVREIVKDVADIEGDRRAGVRSLPQVVGVSAALLVALGLFLVLVILTYIPIFTGWFGRSYEIITVYIVGLPLLALLILVWGNPSGRMLTASSAALKVGMVLGLVALLVA